MNDDRLWAANLVIALGLLSIGFALPIYYDVVSRRVGYSIFGLIAFPLSVTGGALVGYGIYYRRFETRSLPFRVGLPVVGGTLGVTGLTAIRYAFGPDSARAAILEWTTTVSRPVFAIAVALVLAIEIAIFASRYLESA